MPEKDTPRDSPQPDFNAPQSPRRFTQARPRPWSVWVIFLVLLMQGLAVGFGSVAQFIASEPEQLDTIGYIAMLVLYLLLAGVLILLGFRLFMGAAGARTPAMVLQLLIVVLSFSFFAGGLWQVGALFVVPAALAMVLAFTAPTQQWLDESS
ncbi:hypothetical protein [Nesterenkonia suensis]